MRPPSPPLACGEFVIAWLDAGGLTNIVDYTIHLRRFELNGDPAAEEVLVTSSAISSDEPGAGLAGLGDYGYVLLGNSGNSIFGHVWDSGGVVVGGDPVRFPGRPELPPPAHSGPDRG